MKTEAWDLGHRLDLPPRWDAAVHPNARVVHLDQWCWNRLVADRAGERLSEPAAGAYDRLRQLALDGRAVFPLSQTHYLELWERTNIDARWDTAVAMAELSGFNTTTPRGVGEWEARIAVNAFLDLGEDVPAPPFFGWGWHHCVRGVTRPAQIIDTRTGAPPAIIGWTAAQEKAFAEIGEEAVLRMELAMLAMRDPMLEQHGYQPFDAHVRDAGARFTAEQLRVRELIDEHQPKPAQLKNWLDLATFTEMTDDISRASLDLGANPVAVLSSIASAMKAGDKGAVSAFMNLMPIQRVFTALRLEAHLKRDFRFAPSDMADFWAASAGMTFATDVVVDKRTFNLIADSGLGPEYRVKVYRRLEDVVDALEMTA